jgi:predicted nucleotidyltransferase
VFAPLRDLLGKVYGVPAVIAEEFAPLDARVTMFGSYAERWSGKAGPTPRDIDVLVVGDVEPLEAWDAAARASARLGMEVNVVVRDEQGWAEDATGFAQSVKEQPMLDVQAVGAASDSGEVGGTDAVTQVPNPCRRTSRVPRHG